jgi:hypothetical protein
MKRILVVFLFLICSKNIFATEILSYYIYIQTEYSQGPWLRTDVLDKLGSYNYLYIKEFEELFGSEKIDVANSIFMHLKKETESPKLYKFKCDLSLLSDTVIIQTKDSVSNFILIKDELIASFIFNNFIAVKMIVNGQATIYSLKDISIPYFDLVYHTNNILQKNKQNNLSKIYDTTIQVKEIENKVFNYTGNKFQIWFFISLLFNLILVFLFIRIRKK